MSEWIKEAAGLRTYIPDNYGISRARYRELLNFCLQYNDWRRQAGDIYRKNIEMVEDCARQADPRNSRVSYQVRYAGYTVRVDGCADEP